MQEGLELQDIYTLFSLENMKQIIISAIQIHKDNIKMDCKETGCGDIYWIHLVDS